MSRTLLAIDQGTTSTRAILFSEDGEVLDIAQKELKLQYPHKGWVEQDPEEIWRDTVLVCQDVVRRAVQDGRTPVIAGITNQRETTIIWDKHTGESVYNAIVWQDRRTADYCSSLRDAGHEDMIREKTGLLIDPYFSATKIAWILDNVEGARARAEAGDLLFGTIDTYLLWRLTGGQVYATDATNASRTMIYNILNGMWDDDLLQLFNISNVLMPDVRDNISDFGQINPEVLGGVELSIGSMVGDQQSAVIGQGCMSVGMVKSTYGTGCFALMNIGDNFKLSDNRLLTTIAYQLDGKKVYALEGAIFVAGAAIQWLRDGLDIFEAAADSEGLATSVADNNGVYFVPAFTGLGAPYWQPEAKALITGLSRESTKAHVTRAALEAQAYQTRDLMSAMEGDSGEKTVTIRADGGLVHNGFMCQFLADMLDCAVELPKVTEATAWGAACLAGVQAGVFESLEQVSARWVCDKRYEPKMSPEERETLYKGWQDAVGLLLSDRQ